MNYTSFLIKYAEIALKGNNRYLFEDALVQRMAELEVVVLQGVIDIIYHAEGACLPLLILGIAHDLFAVAHEHLHEQSLRLYDMFF